MPSDPVMQLAAASFCAAGASCILCVLSGRMRPRRRTLSGAMLVASAILAMVTLYGAFQAIRAASEIDDGDYALLHVAMPADARLEPVVERAMKDGRITYGEFDTMKFKGAIPDRKVMRDLVSQDVGDLRS